MQRAPITYTHIHTCSQAIFWIVNDHEWISQWIDFCHSVNRFYRPFWWPHLVICRVNQWSIGKKFSIYRYHGSRFPTLCCHCCCRTILYQNTKHYTFGQSTLCLPHTLPDRIISTKLLSVSCGQIRSIVSITNSLSLFLSMCVL